MTQTPDDPPPGQNDRPPPAADGAGFGRRDGPVADFPLRGVGDPPRPPPRRRRPPWLAIVAVVVLALLAGGALGWVWFQRSFLADVPDLPSREALWAVRRTPGMTFVDHDGQMIATRGARYGVRVTLQSLPPHVAKAFLAAEDRRFYQHGAIDLYAIARALRRDVAERRAAEGGSTLTQQLARTLFLKPEHTLKRKIQEAVLAQRLEDMLGKDQVLELYLNRTFFGAAAYGLDAASETYFGHPASQLTLAEAATLAALPNAPSRLSLHNNLSGALGRERRILAIMREEGWITEAQEADALAHPPELAPPRTGEGDWSYILDEAAAQATTMTGGQAPDLVIRLTIDPKLEAAGLEAVRWGVETAGKGRNVSQGALVALAPDGAIRVMVGGLSHDKSAFNRVTQAHRQPGSSFKAFVYGAAMEHGVHPNDIRQDAPIALGAWNPENYGGHYSGAVSVRAALARSINTVSVRLAQEVGPDVVAEFARRCGVTDIPPHPGLSIALGAYEVTLLELAGGYQVFQNGGGRTTPYLIEQLSTTSGQVLYTHAVSAPTPVYDPLFATRMVVMMKGVITGGTGTKANLGRPMAGKTGTSQNWRDAWFVGFTPDMLAGVWVGNDDNRSMAHVTGGELPALIWKRFMTVALKSVPPTDFPWLSTEPEPPPSTGPPSDQVYTDEPPVLEGGQGDMAPPTDQPPDDMQADPNADAPPDGGDFRDTPPDRGDDRDRPPRRGGYYDPRPGDRYPYDDAQPPPRAQPDDDAQDNGDGASDGAPNGPQEKRLPRQRDYGDDPPPPPPQRYRY